MLQYIETIGRMWYFKHLFRHYHRLSDLLFAWLEARPQLYPSQCPYCRQLILEMISLVERMRDIFSASAPHVIQCEGLIDDLYEMLHRPPPSDEPPSTKSGCTDRTLLFEGISVTLLGRRRRFIF